MLRLLVTVSLNFFFVDRISSSFSAAEESLRQTSSSDFNEFRSCAKPPLGCLAITEGVGRLLDPSKDVWEWTDDKKLMAVGLKAFLDHLFQLNKDTISDKQLEKLKAILARDDCQPDHLASISSLCSKLCLWLRALVEYAAQQQDTR